MRFSTMPPVDGSSAPAEGPHRWLHFDLEVMRFFDAAMQGLRVPQHLPGVTRSDSHALCALSHRHLN